VTAPARWSNSRRRGDRSSARSMARPSPPEGTTILDACRKKGKDLPTLCYLETLPSGQRCRVCVSRWRTRASSCLRARGKVEPGMVVHTDTPRVRHSRKMVLELLASSVDLSTTPHATNGLADYACHPERFGPPAPAAAAGVRDAAQAGHHAAPDPDYAATVHQPRRSITTSTYATTGSAFLCYKCVEPAAPTIRTPFAIAVAGRGFDARISTEFSVPLPGSACVYCGNCIAFPTGALMFSSEHDLRAAGTWDESGSRSWTRSVPIARGMHAVAARPGQRDRQSHVALRREHHPRQSLHQGAVRLAVRTGYVPRGTGRGQMKGAPLPRARRRPTARAGRRQQQQHGNGRGSVPRDDGAPGTRAPG